MDKTYTIDFGTTNPQARGVPSARRAVYVMRVLAALAVMDVGYLLIASITDNPLACTPGSFFDCAAAFATPFAHVGPLPTSALGAATYGAILAVLLCLKPSRTPEAPTPHAHTFAWRSLALLVFLAAGAALWFIGVQLTGLSPLCPYCLFTHAMGLTLAVMVVMFAPLPATDVLKTAVLAAVAVLILIAIQTTFPHNTPTQVVRVMQGAAGVPVTSLDEPELSDGKDFDTGPGANRQLGILGGQVRLSPRQLPLAGSPDAPTVMVVLLDYACPNCRKLHRYTASASKRFPGQFATVVLPVPLNNACNPYVGGTEKGHEDACTLAKIALAVWIAKPSEFASFNSWLLDRDETASVKAARDEASKRIGAEKLEATLHEERVDRELRKGIKVYAAANKGSVPRVFVPTKNEKGQPYTLQIVGRPDNENEFFRLLESDLHMKPGEAVVQREPSE